MMQAEENTMSHASDVGSHKEQTEKLREVDEMPLPHLERSISLGIEPLKGVVPFGPSRHRQDTLC